MAAHGCIKLSMPYEYLDHEADIGIRGIGYTLSEAFAESAQAMFSIMADVETVAPRESVAVHCQARDVETLLVEFLNELLFQREARGLLLSSCHVNEIRQNAERWYLDALAWGEPLDLGRHEIRTEVKAATYAALKVGRQGGLYVAQCVVDV